MPSVAWKDNPKAYTRAHNAERRAKAKLAGLCQCCAKNKARVKNGKQLSRCQKCEDDRTYMPMLTPQDLLNEICSRKEVDTKELKGQKAKWRKANDLAREGLIKAAQAGNVTCREYLREMLIILNAR